MPSHGRTSRSGDEKLVFMFSGQGSHYYQSGRDLFERDGAFRRHALEVDALMREELGVSILAELYDARRKPSDRFDRTLSTHCAIFLIEYALGKALLGEGMKPDFVLATSMGTFAALEFAQCLTLHEAVRAVIDQAWLLEALCPDGGMLAVPNLASDAIEALAERFDCDMASINRWSASTLAASGERIDALETALRADSTPLQRLAVSRAFHSRWIDAAREPFLERMARVRFDAAATPIVCCAGAEILHEVGATYLWDVVRRPIRFDDAVMMLCEQQDTPLRFVDVGPSGTLATSLKYGKARLGAPCEIEIVLSPFGGGVLRYERLVSEMKSTQRKRKVTESIAW